MARGLVEIEFTDVWSEYLLVTLLAQLVADEVLQLLANDRAVGRPEDQALAHVFVDYEKLQILAEFAVITGPGLLEAIHIFRELVLGGEGGAVDALELLVFLVAPVVSTGDGEQFERLDLLRVAHMGTGTKVHEFTVLVERDGFAFRDVVETTEFEGFLAPFLDDLYRLFARDFLPAEGLVLFGLFGCPALLRKRSDFGGNLDRVLFRDGQIETQAEHHPVKGGGVHVGRPLFDESK